MGLGIGDYDADGNLDIFKTHFRGDTNILYRGNGKGADTSAAIAVRWPSGIVQIQDFVKADRVVTIREG